MTWIKLGSDGLKGKLPSELQLLTALANLLSYGNQLTKAVRPVWGTVDMVDAGVLIV